MKKNLWIGKRGASWLVLGGVFLLMLLCNIMTLYLVDDFAYMLSFADRQPIDSVWDIIPSMVAHAQSMNGRLVAHGLVQLSLMMPKWVFDVVNSVVFCLLVKLISNISRQGKDTWFIQLGVFCAIWLYVPAFGQVMLWQDGAINYLWAVTGGTFFLSPFISKFMSGDISEWLKKPVGKLCFLLFSFLIGAYSESISAAVIFMAAMLIILDAWMNHRKIDGYHTVAVILAFFGYLTIYMAPAQWANKSIGITVSGLVNNIIDITWKYEAYLSLLIVTAILFIVNIVKKSDPKKILLAAVLTLGALASNYIMALAAEYPDRCALGMVIFHIAAAVVLMEAISWEAEGRMKNICVIVILIMVTIPHFLFGMRSIGVTWKYMRINDQILTESAEQGADYVEVYVFYPDSDYSALYGLKYLDRKDADSWPNDSMAEYYGIEHILGVRREE